MIFQTGSKETIQPFLALTEKPGWEELKQVHPGALAHIHEAFVKQTNLVERIGLIWAMGVLGDDQSVSLLTNMLVGIGGKSRIAGDEAGTYNDEVFVMETSVLALGLLAARHESAYQFIKQGTDPPFWQKSIQWTTASTPSAIGLLTTESVQALGLSGHPAVPKGLQDMKSLPLRNTADSGPGARTFTGDVVQAAYYHDLIT